MDDLEILFKLCPLGIVQMTISKNAFFHGLGSFAALGRLFSMGHRLALHKPVGDADHAFACHRLEAEAPIEADIPGAVGLQVTPATLSIELIAQLGQQPVADSL